MGKTAALAGAAILLAACGGEKALAIQVVTDDPDVATIELFVGDQACDACEGVAPPSSVAKPLGPVEYTGVGTRFTATVGSDGVAGFRLEPDATDGRVEKLAAVGFTANGEPKDFVLDDEGFTVADLAGTIRHYTLTTRTIANAQGATPSVAPENGGDDDPTDVVIVWRAPTALSTDPSCLAIEHRDGTNEFLVPPGDPDCDGVPVARECDPDWYMRSDIQPSACVSTYPSIDTCVLGQHACIDGSQTDCAGSTYCVPNRTCTACSNGEVDTKACLVALIDDAELTSALGSEAQLRCTLQYSTGTPPMVCGGMSNGISAPNLVPNACLVSFVPLGETFPTTATSASVGFASPSVTGKLTTRLTTTTTCGFSLEPTAIITGGPTPHAVRADGLLQLAIPATSHTLLLPIVVDFESLPIGVQCDPTTVMNCVLSGEMDSVYRCAQ